MTTYQLTGEGYVVLDGDTKVPITDSPWTPNTNPYYLEYKQWLAAGGVPEPALPEPPYVPSVVSMRQARLALLGAGLLDDVEAAIAALPSPQKEAAKIEWEYSQEVQRHNGFVSVLAPMLGMPAEQTDALFVQAATL